MTSSRYAQRKRSPTPPPLAGRKMGKKQSRLKPEEAEQLSKATHFTPKEINRWYRGFLRDCPSGVLTQEEFSQIYAQFFPFGEPEKMAVLMYRGLGSGQDGLVRFPQFITALSTITRGSADERITMLFRLYDTDGDGYVSRSDIERMVEAMYSMVGPLLARERDKKRSEKEEEGGEGQTATEQGEGGEGNSELEEDKKDAEIGVLASSRVKELLHMLDKSGGEMVGVEQFMEAVRGDTAIAQAMQHHQQLLL